MTCEDIERALSESWECTGTRGRRQFLEMVAAGLDCLVEFERLAAVREELARRIEAELAREASEILRRAGVLGGDVLGEGAGEAS